MTLLIKAMNVAKEFAGKTLFEHVNLDVYEGERIGIYGRNGVGKTTLLRLLADRLGTDKGGIERRLPLGQWGWMGQLIDSDETMPTHAYVEGGCPDHCAAKRSLKELETRMQDASASCMESLLADYEKAAERYQQLDGYHWELQVERRLLQLGLSSELWELPLGKLSGGQKTRAQLARLMVLEPKLLLLDEPTNHLDAASLEWLEAWIRAYSGTVVFVSHDRHFMDRVATCLVELTPTGSRKYRGGYTAYTRQKELELRTQEQLYRKQQLQREQLEESIRTYRQWFRQGEKSARTAEVPIQRGYFQARAGTHVSRMNAKRKELERLEADRVEKPRDAAHLKVKLGASEFAAHSLVRMERASFRYGNRELFAELSLSVDRGDRLAVLGSNGTGKTTLLKLLVGQLQPAAGTVRQHPQASIGYFSQELEHLDDGETLLDSLLTLPAMTQTQARTILGCFLFSGEEVRKRISELSMGERCRLAFLKLLFSGANLLVLDEPTNYLDIDSRERIEQALLHYPGAMVIVSHDRFFIRKLATKLLWLNAERRPIAFAGTYDEYTEANE
ncbi:ribosomal protection-like ABC-F family protein [Paenibacillus aceris]|uniref:ATP-binding cassette subfamily F protein 3 n=1 Tax=Paenibacillus aceris TaxID=869555 RepID=A0ABS4HSG7_9BACL|nr:ABC-F type ribosomal protection protein [Paenibacillus aceris]MBP1961206.1 ATP-binding cassette subfamily F protein 3 [Paenibacillus aceris]NHW38004.1 ABC-F type ribosomal protection protein [Paenibacillus aceris]